jgi:glutamate synthase (NADPH/NADH) large chain
VVVEGCGSNGCEYMTGGMAVILGAVGDNFGAGMTGGMAFVWDERGDFADRANAETIVWAPLASVYWEGVLRAMVERHARETDSPRAKELLRTWPEARTRFLQVCPKEMVGRLPQPLSDTGTALRA